MAIELKCPGCGRTLRVGEEHAGKQARCPQCQTVTAIPATGSGSPAAPLSGESPAKQIDFYPPASGGANPTAAPLPSSSASPSSGGDRPAGPAPQPSSTAGQSGAGMWQMKTPEGQIYGPVTRQDLENWFHQGRISPDCQLLQQGSSQWQWAGAVFPSLRGPAVQGTPRPLGSGDNPFAQSSDESREMSRASRSPATGYVGGPRPRYVSPHRGPAVLTLGIVGLVVCGLIVGVIAWVMGAHDLGEMKAGRMDPSGREMTQAGMVMGIIGVSLHGLFTLLILCAGFAGI